MGQRWLNEWILGRVSGIPRRFCRGGWHHHPLSEGERAWDRDHWTHPLIFDYHQFICLFVVLRTKELQLTQKKNHLASRKMMDRWLFAMKVVNFRKKARSNWSRRCTRWKLEIQENLGDSHKHKRKQFNKGKKNVLCLPLVTGYTAQVACEAENSNMKQSLQI